MSANLGRTHQARACICERAFQHMSACRCSSAFPLDFMLRRVRIDIGVACRQKREMRPQLVCLSSPFHSCLQRRDHRLCWSCSVSQLARGLRQGSGLHLGHPCGRRQEDHARHPSVRAESPSLLTHPHRPRQKAPLLTLPHKRLLRKHNCTFYSYFKKYKHLK